MLKDHEKFFAFIMLGGFVFALALMAYFHQIPEGSGSQRIVDAAMGGLLLALGGAANALFRITTSSEQAQIGEATAKAISERGPMETKVTNTPEDPVPTAEERPKA